MDNKQNYTTNEPELIPQSEADKQPCTTVNAASNIAISSTVPTPQPERARQVRRVGTFTMGVALIVVGLTLCASLLVPTADILLIAKLSPLLLVALGLEIIIAAVKNDGNKIKYDFLSFFMCIFLIFGAISASLLPTLLEYIGPEREVAESRISNQITDALANKQNLFPDVYSITANVALVGVRKFTGVETIDDVLESDWISIYAQFGGDYEDEKAFAEAILPFYNAANEVTSQQVQLSAESIQRENGPIYSIDLGGGKYTNITPQILADYVTRIGE